MLKVGSTCPTVDGLEALKGQLPVINGNPRDKMLVLEFWATWCPPCRQSIPHVTEVQHQFKDDLDVVGITNEKAGNIKAWVDSMGAQMDYTVAVDPTGQANRNLMQAAGATGIPHAFLVSREGKIVYSGHPMDPDFESAVRRYAPEGKKKKALQPLNFTRDQLSAMSIKELKGILTEREVSFTGLLEKADFVEKILELAAAQ